MPAGLPKPLSEADVTSLLDAVVGDEPVALRDRALLELLYATGARISEACGLSMGDIDFDARLVRLFGKGSKERIVPFGRAAGDGARRVVLAAWPGAPRAGAVAPARRRRGRVPQPARRPADPPGGVGGRQALRRAGRAARRAVAARAAALVRHPPARPRRRPARRPGAARPRLDRRRRRCTRRSARSGCSTVYRAAHPRATTDGDEGPRSPPRAALRDVAVAGAARRRRRGVGRASWLAPGERELWSRMSNADRRHAIEVARRFVGRRPDATRPEMAGALLHDVGKVEADLGTFGRVVATVVGPRGRRLRLLPRPRGHRRPPGRGRRRRPGDRRPDRAPRPRRRRPSTTPTRSSGTPASRWIGRRRDRARPDGARRGARPIRAGRDLGDAPERCRAGAWRPVTSRGGSRAAGPAGPGRRAPGGRRRARRSAGGTRPRRRRRGGRRARRDAPDRAGRWARSSTWTGSAARRCRTSPPGRAAACSCGPGGRRRPAVDQRRAHDDGGRVDGPDPVLGGGLGPPVVVDRRHRVVLAVRATGATVEHDIGRDVDEPGADGDGGPGDVRRCRRR